jgi:hypothetical protein
MKVRHRPRRRTIHALTVITLTPASRTVAFVFAFVSFLLANWFARIPAV